MAPSIPNDPSQAQDATWGALMVAAQAGDRRAYTTLLRVIVPFIKSVARRQGVGLSEIDDVVQDVLVTIHKSRQSYDPERSFTAWLRALTQRRAVDLLRRHGRSTAREVHEPIAYENHPAPEHEPDGSLGLAQLGASIMQAISTLPSGQREAVEMLTLRDISLADAAAATGRTKGALKVNLHRALKALRAQLGGDWT